MQKTSQEKRGQYVADSRDKPQCGETFYQIFLLFFNISTQRESKNIINTRLKQIYQINSQVSSNQKVNGGQSYPKTSSKQQSHSVLHESQIQPKFSSQAQSKERENTTTIFCHQT